MILDSLPAILGLTGLAGLLAAAIVYVLGRVLAPSRAAARALADAAGPGTVFLFDGPVLVDATDPARRLLARKERHQTDWEALLALLSRRFPDVRQRLADLPGSGQVTVEAERGTETLHADYCEGLLRLHLSLGEAGDGRFDRLAVAAMEEELEMLRSIAEDAPQLIWKEDAGGAVIWANQSYLALSERLHPTASDDDPVWNSRPVLDLSATAQPSVDGAPIQRRLSLRVPGAETPQWFEVTSVRRGAEVIRFAVDANSAVEAETARRVFVQTLTKTFAHLATGLVIFDRQRRLVLFNPAFLDLTGLPAGFLSSRPLVQTVLDRLRDMHMLPEPKNYVTWRDQVAALESQAAEGTYCEAWSLPSGLTYRVSGRPHPEGAIAFLFEDISDEVALTRRYRSELETAQAVFDSLDDAVAVFSVGGTMILSNAAYHAAFGPGGDGLRDTTLGEQSGLWQAMAQPGPAWADVQRAARGQGDRAAWAGTLQLLDGRPLALQMTPLVGGAIVARFRLLAAEGGFGLVPGPWRRSDSDATLATFRSGRRAAIAAALASDPIPLADSAVTVIPRAGASPRTARPSRASSDGEVRPGRTRRGGAAAQKPL